jgi:hypothetical protein
MLALPWVMGTVTLTLHYFGVWLSPWPHYASLLFGATLFWSARAIAMKRLSPLQLITWESTWSIGVMSFAMIFAEPWSDWGILKSPWTGQAFFLAVVVVLGLCAGRRWRQLRSRLVAANGRICIQCLYALNDLPTPGNCPECGKPFPKDAHVSVWEKTTGPIWRQPPLWPPWR